MNWTNETAPQPPRQSAIEHGALRLSVSPYATDPSRGQWQWCIMSFGSHTEASHKECLKTWPREAIARAREELDKFELLLGENDEADLEKR